MTIPTRLTSRMLFALIVLLPACDQRAMPALDTAASSSPSAVGFDMKDHSRRGVTLGAANTAKMRLEEVQVTASRESAQRPPSQPVAGMIIRNGAVTIQIDSLEIAIDRIRALTASLGGYLGNVSIQTGEHQVRSATLEMKIPAARFDSAMTGMPALGKVEHSSSTAEDVGEEFVDVSARVANAKRLEARLVTLLATRTARLQDVLAVERELARVREEIERYEGRIRFLSSRVATSTIQATVHEKAPIIAAQPGTNVFSTAFLNMWRNFVRFLAGGIEALGLLAPLGGLVWLGWFAWRRWRRGRLSPAT